MLALEIRRSVLDETEIRPKESEEEEERKSALTPRRSAVILVTPNTGIFAGWGPRALL